MANQNIADGMLAAPLDFAVIGAQKAGSTFLHRCLDLHPNLWMPEGEVAVFEQASVSRNQVNEILCKGTQMRQGKYLIGIKRPNLLGNVEAIRKLVDFYPNIKVIVILRDPMARTISAYYHYIRQGYLPVRHIEDGLPKLLSKEWQFLYWRSFEVLEFSRYVDHLSRLCKIVNSKNIFVGTFDALINDTHKFLSRVASFLDVPDVEIDVSELSSTKPQSVVYSLKRLHVLTLEHRVRSTVDSEGCVIKGGKKKELSESDLQSLARIKEFDNKVLRQYLDNEKPVLSEGLKMRLDEEFSRELELVACVRSGGDWTEVLDGE